MSEDKYDLDIFIKNSFEGTIEYFKTNNIQIEGKLSLITLESYDEYQQKYGKNTIIQVGEYDGQANEIHIIKNGLKGIINREVNNPNKIFIGNLFTITHSGIPWPVYKNDDIEKVIAKTITDLIVTHEIVHAVLHSIGSNDEWKASVFEFLVYFYKNELYKYPEVYEIMEQNIKRCERFMQEKCPYIYALGSCFANDLIYIYENLLNKDKQSPKLNIKNVIEKLKYFSEDEYIDATKMINTLTKILMLLYQ
jgi:hypothetical protein